GLEFNPKFELELRQLIAKHNRPWLPPVFIYGNLSSLNILVYGDKVIRIVN
ncbi:uncharacterized protein K441DRAFT_586224, partial [Cenococcum geophilum 1.58]|uniref:uncharacterized protein n=1 Tax=Cenococcum geophilum 1.58 TaxID=794803 RepID=UPI00358DEAA4